MHDIFVVNLKKESAPWNINWQEHSSSFLQYISRIISSQKIHIDLKDRYIISYSFSRPVLLFSPLSFNLATMHSDSFFSSPLTPSHSLASYSLNYLSRISSFSSCNICIIYICLKTSSISSSSSSSSFSNR